MANEFLRYTSKDYNSIYNELIAAIPGITDLWTNTEDGDPGIVLVKLMSALGDMMSFNMDKQALEYYASTVTQRKNAAKLLNLIGYKMHWYRSATNRIAVTNTVVTPYIYQPIIIYQKYLLYAAIPNPTHEQQLIMEGLWIQCEQLTQQYVIPKYPQTDYQDYYDNGVFKYDAMYTDPGSPLRLEYDPWLERNTINIFTYICSNRKTIDVRNGNRFDTAYIIKPTTDSNATGNGDYLNSTDDIAPGETHEFDVIQGSLQCLTFNSERLRNNRYYFTESAIDEDNIWVSYIPTNSNQPINSETFITKVDNLLTVTDGDIHFEFGIDEFDIPYIELSSYWAKGLDNYAADFKVYYVRTSGVYGNITKDFLNTIEGIPRGSYTITHPANNVPYIDSMGKLIATPGYHPQTAHQAYIDSMNYVTTFDTLVTIYDFERFCKRQPGIGNTYAVDKQRAKDLNTALTDEANSLSLAQLEAYYTEAKNNGTVSPSEYPPETTDTEELRRFYIEFYIKRKKVVYNEFDTNQDYLAYGLNLHVVFGDFATSMYYENGVADVSDTVATMKNYLKRYWLYKLVTNYEVDYVLDINGNPVRDADGRKIIKHTDPDSIEDVKAGDGRVAHFLDEKLRTTKICNVSPEYAAVRVFPWRCCGTIYLRNPVSQSVADKILETVMEHLSTAFHPSNIEFGKKISYMDVINVVTNAHEMISYFDAGLASRQLIDVDESVDITYFNNTSLMYYVQSPDGIIVDDQTMYGNNVSVIPGTSEPNPYYKLLSIAPEYIIRG